MGTPTANPPRTEPDAEPLLGLATTEDLLREIEARMEVALVVAEDVEDRYAAATARGRVRALLDTMPADLLAYSTAVASVGPPADQGKASDGYTPDPSLAQAIANADEYRERASPDAAHAKPVPPDLPCARCGHRGFDHALHGYCDASRGGVRLDNCEGFVYPGADDVEADSFRAGWRACREYVRRSFVLLFDTEPAIPEEPSS